MLHHQVGDLEQPVHKPLKPATLYSYFSTSSSVSQGLLCPDLPMCFPSGVRALA